MSRVFSSVTVTGHLLSLICCLRPTNPSGLCHTKLKNDEFLWGFLLLPVSQTHTQTHTHTRAIQKEQGSFLPQCFVQNYAPKEFAYECGFFGPQFSISVPKTQCLKTASSFWYFPNWHQLQSTKGLFFERTKASPVTWKGASRQNQVPWNGTYQQTNLRSITACKKKYTGCRSTTWDRKFHTCRKTLKTFLVVCFCFYFLYSICNRISPQTLLYCVPDLHLFCLFSFFSKIALHRHFQAESSFLVSLRHWCSFLITQRQFRSVHFKNISAACVHLIDHCFHPAPCFEKRFLQQLQNRTLFSAR